MSEPLVQGFDFEQEDRKLISLLVPSVNIAERFGNPSLEEILLKPETLTDAQKMFFHIYGEANRQLGLERLWSRLVRTIGLGIIKNIRKNRIDECVPQIANATSYLCGIANEAGFLMQDALWYKVPGLCSFCLEADCCECFFGKTSSKGKTPEGFELLRKLRTEKKNVPVSWYDWQMSQKRIYSRRHEELQVSNLAMHVIEEACEVGEEMELGVAGAEEMKIEVADGLSWLMAVCNHLNRSREAHRQIYLGELVWEHYRYSCKKCHRNVCCGECGKRVGA